MLKIGSHVSNNGDDMLLVQSKKQYHITLIHL